MNISMMERGGPPLISFDRREDPLGRKGDDGFPLEVDLVLIRVAGDKDVREAYATEWLDARESDARDNPPRYPPDWAKGHRENYRRWKEGQELVQDGYPIRLWAAVTKAQADHIARANILTVEALATANDDALAMIGMGARAIKERAIKWIETKNSSTEQTAEALSKLKGEVEVLKQSLEIEREKNVRLSAEIAAEPQRKRA